MGLFQSEHMLVRNRRKKKQTTRSCKSFNLFANLLSWCVRWRARKSHKQSAVSHRDENKTSRSLSVIDWGLGGIKRNLVPEYFSIFILKLSEGTFSTRGAQANVPNQIQGPLWNAHAHFAMLCWKMSLSVVLRLHFSDQEVRLNPSSSSVRASGTPPIDRLVISTVLSSPSCARCAHLSLLKMQILSFNQKSRVWRLETN